MEGDGNQVRCFLVNVFGRIWRELSGVCLMNMPSWTVSFSVLVADVVLNQRFIDFIVMNQVKTSQTYLLAERSSTKMVFQLVVLKLSILCFGLFWIIPQFLDFPLGDLSQIFLWEAFNHWNQTTYFSVRLKHVETSSWLDWKEQFRYQPTVVYAMIGEPVPHIVIYIPVCDCLAQTANPRIISESLYHENNLK